MTFSLLEFILAMSIGLILLLCAVPSYQHLQAANTTTTIVRQMATAIHDARSEALAQGKMVALCGSGDGLHCDGQWQAGQIMILEQDGQLLRVFPGVASGERLWWQSSLGHNDILKLAPTGFTDGQRGSFYYCPRHGASQYGAKIVVSDSARVRVETGGQDLQTICTT